MLNVLFLCVILVLLFVAGRWLLRSLKLGGLSGRYVFITGCDTGFGNLLAKRLDSLGMNVFAGCLTSKGQNDLDAATSKRLVTLALDVTNDDSVRKAYDEVRKRLPEGKGLWGLVNNAGVVGDPSHVEWQTVDNYRKCNDVNLYGMIRVSTMFLPLVRKTRGRIVNITSIIGRIALIHGTYVVSKYGAEGFCDCLRYQLYHCGVSVHIIEPGFFKTGFVDLDIFETNMKRSYEAMDTERKEFYGENYIPEVIAASRQNLETVLCPELYRVVDAFTHALIAVYPKTRYVVGTDANFLFRLIWNLPEWLGDRVVAKIFTLPVPKGCREK